MLLFLAYGQPHSIKNVAGGGKGGNEQRGEREGEGRGGEGKEGKTISIGAALNCATSFRTLCSLSLLFILFIVHSPDKREVQRVLQII